MFSGIIEDIGSIRCVEREKGYARIQCASRCSEQLRSGNSVAVNGVCLTVVESDSSSFWVEAMAMTLEKTTFATVAVGQRVNIEPAIRLADAMDGHLVQGHVDTVAEVTALWQEGKNWFLRIGFHGPFHQFCIAEGGISVHGISLTIAELGNSDIVLNIIPETYQRTMIGDLKPQDAVNIEFDIIGRYVAQLYQPYRLIESRVGVLLYHAQNKPLPAWPMRNGDRGRCKGKRK